MKNNKCGVYPIKTIGSCCLFIMNVIGTDKIIMINNNFYNSIMSNLNSKMIMLTKQILVDTYI